MICSAGLERALEGYAAFGGVELTTRCASLLKSVETLFYVFDLSQLDPALPVEYATHHLCSNRVSR